MFEVMWHDCRGDNANLNGTKGVIIAGHELGRLAGTPVLFGYPSIDHTYPEDVFTKEGDHFARGQRLSIGTDAHVLPDGIMRRVRLSTQNMMRRTDALTYVQSLPRIESIISNDVEGWVGNRVPNRMPSMRPGWLGKEAQQEVDNIFANSPTSYELFLLIKHVSNAIVVERAIGQLLKQGGAVISQLSFIVRNNFHHPKRMPLLESLRMIAWKQFLTLNPAYYDVLRVLLDVQDESIEMQAWLKLQEHKIPNADLVRIIKTCPSLDAEAGALLLTQDPTDEESLCIICHVEPLRELVMKLYIKSHYPPPPQSYN